MNLATDEQTISDLGIFGKRNGHGIYDLYNRTHTRGGEALLKDLFSRPLSDREEINRRSSIIGHFATLDMAFPFEAALFDMAEKYLQQAEESARQASQRSILGEKEIQQGVTAVIALVQQVNRFIETKEAMAIPAYEKERSALASLLADPVFEPVLSEKLKAKISYTAVAAYDVLFRLREYHKIKILLGSIYYLDVYLSVAKLAVERKFVFPKALDKERHLLRLEGVYHPELTHPVGNGVDMDAGRNVLFLTGANMAGKSTFLRSVSTAVYVAHIGFPVAAQAMEFSVLDGLYTTINLPDNLGIGASHFYSEVLRVKKVATELHQRKSLFIVFDELFRGTNVKDAHEATVAVTEAFAKTKSSLFIISSHIVEAGEDLRKEPSIGFQYLPTRMKGHVPEYTYTLEPGITDDRHGMIIIRNEGILDILKNGRKKKTVKL
jgi:DNA mismatch repair ATPase MutS